MPMMEMMRRKMMIGTKMCVPIARQALFKVSYRYQHI